MSYVYLMKNELGLVKVGKSRSPEFRRVQIQNNSGLKVEITHILASEKHSEIEEAAHVILDAHRKAGEWFDVSTEEAIEAVEQAAMAATGEVCRLGVYAAPLLGSARKRLARAEESRRAQDEVSFRLTPHACQVGRAALDWTQGQLAENAHVNLRTVQDFERGARIPLDRTLEGMLRTMETAGIRFLETEGSVFCSWKIEA